ncbi:hypothetical protein ABWH96_06895 [Marivirga tractuosa]|uniref:hypothetical protein n=1 Tax=Marivirga tractuosa TaxID=1006 RepID=UPI0035CFFE46
MKQLYLFILLILSSFLSYSQSDCGDAVTASEGLNSFNTIGYDSYWFTYELSAGKKVTISSTDFVNFDISSGPDCDNRTNIVYDYQNVTISNLEDGATLYIRLSRFNTETFEFRLVSSDLISGDNCNLATSANEGVNSFDADAYVPRWFRFELPEDKKLTLNSSSYGEVAMFSGSDCEYPSNYTSGDTNLSFTRLSTGGTVFIKINPYNTEVFEFELTVSDFETGDNCELADQAVDGVNSFPVTTNSIYWYKYTMVKSGNLNMDFTGYRPVNVYKGSNCAGKFFISGASFPRTLTGLNAGDDLYFQWTNNGDFDFTLTEADPIPGESCETAEIAVLGTNSIPSTNVDYFWYTYRMPTDLNQKIIIEAGNDRDITVYSGNCESFSTLGSSDGALKVLGLASDEDIYIRIDTNGSGDFDWNLGVESEGVGDSCDDPEVATTGSNFTPVSPYWFSYTTPIAGTYTISSVGLATEDTYLRVYSDCQGTLIGENDDFSGLQSEVELELSEEQTIYILWDDTYNAEGFSWNISSDAIPDEKEDQTITFNSLDSRTFGDADFELTAETSSGLAVSYTSSNTVVATVSGSTVSILEPGSTIITASQTGNVAYNAADPVERTLTIKKANQTISLDAISDKLVTDADFTIPATATSGLTLSYSVSGFVQ